MFEDHRRTTRALAVSTNRRSLDVPMARSTHQHDSDGPGTSATLTLVTYALRIRSESSPRH